MTPRKELAAEPAGPLGEYEAVRPADLSPYFRNPRIGNVPMIVESLKRHGQYKPLVVNRGTFTGRPKEVLAGNHMLRAGLELGLERMDVRWVDLDDDAAARVVAIDNRSSDKGSYDNALLAELLVELGDDLSGTGYSEGDLTRLLNGLEEGDAEGLTDPDALPAIPENPITQVGDVWLLGKHRLVCGDSTQRDVVALATGGAEPDALWTDPPYGVEYVGKTKDALTIQNDGAAGLRDLLDRAFVSALGVLRPGAPCYVAHADSERVNFEGALREAGYLVRQNLVWVKNTLVLGRSDYQYKHEPILEAEAPPAELEEDAGVVDHEPVLYGFTPGAKGRLGRGGDRWYGNNKQTTVFQIDKPSASRVHPTMKPVELIVGMLRNSVVRGGSVLDIFAGSGSTLIAAHQIGLIAYLVELSPKFCDVICRRYQEHAGVMPILERTGEARSFVEAD